MSERPPRPSVTPSSLVLTAPGRSVTASLEVVNRGGGRLRATLEGGAPWLAVDPRVIEDNHVRVAVTVDASGLPEDAESTSSLQLKWDRFSLDIPVRVTRQGLGRAWRLYQEGQRHEARAQALAVAQTSSRPEAPLLIAVTFIDDGNQGAAIRPLRDAGAAFAALEDCAPLEACAGALMRRFTEAIGPVLPSLRDARYCTQLIEEVATRAAAVDPTLQAPTSALLIDAAHRFVEAYAPNVLPPDDLADSRAFVTRMQARLPDDARWAAWLEQEREVAQAPLKRFIPAEPVERSRRPPVIALALLAAVALATFAALYAWPKWRLGEPRALLEAGRYADAMKALQAATVDALDTREAIELRERIHYEWSKHLFLEGRYREGADQLAAALHDDPDNAEMLAFKRKTYREWARRAESQGRISDACDALNELAVLRPPDAAAVQRLRQLAPLRQLYALLNEIATIQRNGAVDANAPSHPIDGTGGGGRGGWGRFMQARGITWYDGRVQVALIELYGDGRQQVAVAGSNRQGAGGLQIYVPRTDDPPRMQQVATCAASPGLTLLSMRVGKLASQEGRSGVEAELGPSRNGAPTQAIALYARNGRVERAVSALSAPPAPRAETNRRPRRP